MCVCCDEARVDALRPATLCGASLGLRSARLTRVYEPAIKVSRHYIAVAEFDQLGHLHQCIVCSLHDDRQRAALHVGMDSVRHVDQAAFVSAVDSQNGPDFDRARPPPTRGAFSAAAQSTPPLDKFEARRNRGPPMFPRQEARPRKPAPGWADMFLETASAKAERA